MNSLLTKYLLPTVAASIAIGSSLVAGAAQAAIVGYNFTVDYNSNSYDGNFTYDDSVGTGTTDFASFSFNFVDSTGAATTYDETDLAPAGSEVGLVDGNLSYFSFSSNTNPYFFGASPTGVFYSSYKPTISGSITQVEKVPEPLSVLGAGSALGFMAFLKKRKSAKKEEKETAQTLA